MHTPTHQDITGSLYLDHTGFLREQTCPVEQNETEDTKTERGCLVPNPAALRSPKNPQNPIPSLSPFICQGGGGGYNIMQLLPAALDSDLFRFYQYLNRPINAFLHHRPNPSPRLFTSIYYNSRASVHVAVHAPLVLFPLVAGFPHVNVFILDVQFWVLHSIIFNLRMHNQGNVRDSFSAPIRIHPRECIRTKQRVIGEQEVIF